MWLSLSSKYLAMPNKSLLSSFSILKKKKKKNTHSYCIYMFLLLITWVYCEYRWSIKNLIFSRGEKRATIYKVWVTIVTTFQWDLAHFEIDILMSLAMRSKESGPISKCDRYKFNTVWTVLFTINFLLQNENENENENKKFNLNICK